MDYGYNNQYTTTTSYGAQGGGDGGGFMPGEAGGSSPAGGKGGYGKDTVRPVTIKQVLEAQQPHPESAEFKVDGDFISQITFVGQIRNVSTQTTNTTYKVDDGTGIVEVKQWIDPASDNAGMEDSSNTKLVENAYCRVWGKLKAFHEKRHVGAHVIRPITDYNEINYHLLEATAIHLLFTRGPPTSAAGNGQNGATNGATVGTETASNGRSMPKMSPLGRRMYNLLKETAQSNEGLHVQMLASQLGVGVNECYKEAEELLAVGLIFTTVDDNTWAVLEY